MPNGIIGLIAIFKLILLIFTITLHLRSSTFLSPFYSSTTSIFQSPVKNDGFKVQKIVTFEYFFGINFPLSLIFTSRLLDIHSMCSSPNHTKIEVPLHSFNLELAIDHTLVSSTRTIISSNNINHATFFGYAQQIHS